MGKVQYSNNHIINPNNNDCNNNECSSTNRNNLFANLTNHEIPKNVIDTVALGQKFANRSSKQQKCNQNNKKR